MKKSSLGRKSTTRDNGRRTDFHERPTGIPLLTRSISSRSIQRPTHSTTMRDLSADRQSTSRARSPCNDRMSEHRREAMRTSRGFAGMTGRRSSYSDKRGDNRPLTDKDWQIEALKTVEEAAMITMEGANILQAHKSLKPMSISCFVQLSNFFLNTLDNKITINQVNYPTELPYILRLIGYRGKLERSLFQTVNALHAWPNVLGILHYLAELVLAYTYFKEHALDIMYPDSIEADTDAQAAEDISFKYALPCLQYLMKNNREDQSVEELVESNMDKVKEVFSLSGFNKDVFAKEEELQRIFEETNLRLNEQMRKYSEINSKRELCEDEIMAVDEENRKIVAESIALEGANDDSLKEIANMEEELSLMDKKLLELDSFEAQCASSGGVMTTEECKNYQDEIKRLQEDIHFSKKFALDTALKKFELSWETDKLEKQRNELFVQYTRLASEILEHDPSIKDAISYSRPCLGQTPCNEATATILESLQKSWVAKTNHIETEIQNFDYKTKKDELDKEVNESRIIYNQMKSTHDIAVFNYKQDLLNKEKELEKAVEEKNKLLAEFKLTEEKHAASEAKYAEKEAQFKHYEDLTRKYYAVCQSKLDIKQKAVLDFKRRCQEKISEVECEYRSALTRLKKRNDQLKNLPSTSKE